MQSSSGTLILMALLLSPSMGSKAQTAFSGGLTGVVRDSSNAVVPNARVVLRDNVKGTTQSIATNTEGAYLFSFLVPGVYTLTVSRAGFQTTKRILDIYLGPPGTLNIQLAVASVSTSVKVTAEGPLIGAESGDVSTTIQQKEISAVPNPGNDITYICASRKPRNI